MAKQTPRQKKKKKTKKKKQYYTFPRVAAGI